MRKKRREVGELKRKRGKRRERSRGRKRERGGMCAREKRERGDEGREEIKTEKEGNERERKRVSTKSQKREERGRDEEIHKRVFEYDMICQELYLVVAEKREEGEKGGSGQEGATRGRGRRG